MVDLPMKQSSIGRKKLSMSSQPLSRLAYLRYAAISNLHIFLKSQNIHVLHIVANPSIYLYLSKSRYKFNDDGKIVEASSDAIADCPNYNHYKYGLENLYGYSAQINTDEIKKRLLSRQIMFLLGTSDNKRDWGLNKSCAGDARGNNRYERGFSTNITCSLYLVILKIIGTFGWRFWVWTMILQQCLPMMILYLNYKIHIFENI